MISKIKKTVLVAFLFGTMSSYANEGVYNVGEGKVSIIELDYVKKGQRLYIKDTNNNILFEQEIERNGSYTNQFDFSTLKDGYYVLEMNKDFEIVETPFAIKSGVAFFNNSQKKKVYKPYVRVKDNKVLVSKLNFNKNSLEITIYYKGIAIHHDEVTNEEFVNKVYALDTDIKGNYRVEIKSEGKLFYNNLSI